MASSGYLLLEFFQGLTFSGLQELTADVDQISAEFIQSERTLHALQQQYIDFCLNLPQNEGHGNFGDKDPHLEDN